MDYSLKYLFKEANVSFFRVTSILLNIPIVVSSFVLIANAVASAENVLKKGYCID